MDAEDEGGKWFKTGDIAVRRHIKGVGQYGSGTQAANGDDGQEWVTGPAYFILGRKSTDIIKTGGEKVSALEIERELLSLYAFLFLFPPLSYFPSNTCPPANNISGAPSPKHQSSVSLPSNGVKKSALSLS